MKEEDEEKEEEQVVQYQRKEKGRAKTMKTRLSKNPKRNHLKKFWL